MESYYVWDGCALESKESLRFEVPGGYLDCVRYPNADAPQVLGLHGFADTCETFQFILPAFDKFELFCPSMRGHGDSSRIEQGYYSAGLYFGDLIQFAGSLRKPYVLMGHSMGAAIAARFAGLYPDEISALVLMEGFSGIAPAEEEIRRLKSWGDALRRKRPDRVRVMKSLHEAELILKTVHQTLPPERISLLAKSLARETPEGFVWRQDVDVKNGGIPIPFSPQFSRALWARVKCPVLFIYGESSHLLPGNRENGAGSLDEILGHFSQLEKHSLPCGHNPHHELPEQVIEILREFFAKHKLGKGQV
ncbi:MAG: alpha/beta hydrolase [Spirochaetia bacterium]|nr:alpha/beta hydrolase [Spirochaetia bacterium]